MTAAPLTQRPRTLADVAARATDEPTFALALSEFLDDFYAHPDRRAGALAARPPLFGRPRWDATLGAVAEHLARRWGLTVPPWSDEPERFLRRPYFATPIEDLKAMLLVQSPLAFRRRMIFVEAEPLRRARWPEGG